jgi:hypothetical protein
MTNEEIMRLALEQGVLMRDLQKRYFDTRDRNDLDQCRKAEKTFDRMAKSALEDRLL